MNFLAHLLLSGDDPELALGNFMGDFVKGRQHELLPAGVARGVLLHRFIDAQTDAHPLCRQSAERLRPIYGRHAGVVVDIFYDHLLATHWERFSATSLRAFTLRAHRLLLDNHGLLPERLRDRVPHLVASDRLHSYARVEGIAQTLDLMARHTSLPDQSGPGIRLLEEARGDFLGEFDGVFRTVAAAVSERENLFFHFL